MSGHRALQTANLRSAMLQAAARLFNQQGFHETTIAEIAEATGCGVATVYKYFRSKEGIAVAMLAPDFDRILAAAQGVIESPPPDPVDALITMLSEYRELGGQNWSQRELLKLTIFPGLGNEGALKPLILETDARVQVQIRALLQGFQRRRQLSARLDLDDAASVVFAVFNQHFGRFLTQPELRFETMFRRLTRQLRCLFGDWRAPRRRP